MFKLFFLYLIIISSPLFSQQSKDTSMLLLRFSEPMSREGIFNPDNYTIYCNDSTQLIIFKVGIVPGDSAVVLFTEKHKGQASYKIIVNNLRDKAGNFINKKYNFAFY